MKFKPYTEIRTGIRIDTLEKEIDECYRFSHEVKDIMKIETKYGIWMHGRCSNCGCPIDNWYHSHYCGNCGALIGWGVINSERL